MFWTALLVSVIVNLVCQFGSMNRARGTIVGFLLAVVAAGVILMQSGHWAFHDPAYYAIVAAAAFTATVAVWIGKTAIRRKA